jgi:hypothetical protein
MSIVEKNAKVENCRDQSSLDRNNYVHLKVEAPTTDEAEQLFTKKLKELNIKT